MSGLDDIIATSFATRLENDLGDGILGRIKNEFMTNYGITLHYAIKVDYPLFDETLIKIFGKYGSREIQRKCLTDIFKISKHQNIAKITFHNQSLCRMILNSYVDDIQRKILFSIAQKPKCFQDVFSEYTIPNTTFYRKANELINSGLIVSVTGNYQWNGKTVSRYKSLFNGVTASFGGKMQHVQGIISKDMVASSLILKVLD